MPKRPDLRILFWVPLPPPYSGPSVGSAHLMAEVAKCLPSCTIENATVRLTNISKGRFDVTGLVAFSRSYATFLAALLCSRCQTVYMVIAPGTVGFLRDAVLIWTAWLARKRVVLHLRGGNYSNFYASSPPLLRFLIRHTWRRASRAIVQSPRLVTLLADCAPAVPISVLPNGLPQSEVSDHPPRSSQPPITLLFLAYLSYTKGFNDLIAAYKVLHERYGTGIRLVFAGEQPENGAQFATFLQGERRAFYLSQLHALEEDVARFIRDAATFNAEYCGVVAGGRKQTLLNEADIFVLPSYMEGFSMAILEAMFAGLPVVTTAVGSSPDIIRDGENGFLIPPGDVAALEDRLRRLIDDVILRRAIGVTNAREARRDYAIEHVAEKMIDILAHV